MQQTGIIQKILVFFSDMMSDKIERVYQWGLRRLLAHPLCHYDSSNIYEANLNSWEMYLI